MSKLLDRYQKEYYRTMALGGYNIAWFWLHYGKKRGNYIYNQKSQTQGKRLTFLKKRIKELSK